MWEAGGGGGGEGVGVGIIFEKTKIIKFLVYTGEWEKLASKLVE